MHQNYAGLTCLGPQIGSLCVVPPKVGKESRGLCKMSAISGHDQCKNFANELEVLDNIKEQQAGACAMIVFFVTLMTVWNDGCHSMISVIEDFQNQPSGLSYHS